jgi:hypothetical protein
LANLKKVMSTVDSKAVPAIWNEIHAHCRMVGRSNILLWPHSERFEATILL